MQIRGCIDRHGGVRRVGAEDELEEAAFGDQREVIRFRFDLPINLIGTVPELEGSNLVGIHGPLNVRGDNRHVGLDSPRHVHRREPQRTLNLRVSPDLGIPRKVATALQFRGEMHLNFR